MQLYLLGQLVFFQPLHVLFYLKKLFLFDFFSLLSKSAFCTKSSISVFFAKFACFFFFFFEKEVKKSFKELPFYKNSIEMSYTKLLNNIYMMLDLLF